MNISAREKKLLTICAIVVLSGLAFLPSMLGDAIGAQDFNDEALIEAKQQFEEYKELMEDWPRIKEELAAIDDYLPDEDFGDREPRDVLPIKVNDLFGQFSVTAKSDPPRNEFIRDIDEYKWLLIEVKFSAEEKTTMNILKALDNQGFFINDLTMNSTLDKDNLNVSLSLKRLVKVTEEELRIRRQLRERGRDSGRRGAI